MTNINRIFDEQWEFYISRNIPVWHNTLQLIKGDAAYRHYKLNKMYVQLRVHRGLESDFYYPLTGSRSFDTFVKSIDKNIEKKEYINFLKKEYKKDCDKLLNFSKRIKTNEKSLKAFLNYYGFCTSLLDITSWSSKVLTDNIMNDLKNIPQRDEVIAFYSTPKQLAPVQKLKNEVDKFYKSKDLDTVAKKLWKKYCWIPVGFVGEPWGIEYFLNLLNTHHKNTSVSLKKPNVILSAKQMHLLWALSQITYLNEYRKGIFCQVSLNIRPVLDEVAKHGRLNNWKEASLLTHDELLLAVKGKNLSKIVARRKGEIFGLHNIVNNKINFIYGKTVSKFENKFKIKNSNVSEFGGVIGNKGKITGIVKVILNHSDFEKFNDGDILVAKMTSVDFLPIMKRAGAFVTDEGGLACHAAVVSREFGLPCIIGTKVATAVLKDGDKVEVDANNGIIKKIN